LHGQNNGVIFTVIFPLIGVQTCWPSNRENVDYAMTEYSSHFSKGNPMVRVFIFIAAGILWQWYQPFSWFLWCSLLLGSLILLPALYFFPLSIQYKYSWCSGILLFTGCVATGALLTWKQDIRNDKNWFANVTAPDCQMVFTLKEDLVEKANSFKAVAAADTIICGNALQKIDGKIILYFSKDSLLPPLQYGSIIILKKSEQEIKNSGNPGAFDFKRFCLFQGVTHQVYLKPGDYAVIPGRETSSLVTFLNLLREKVLTILKANIGGKKELGLAEALLIGYKDDVDKELVQSYSNTGVVHIIAISGLHLGLIYGLLLIILKPLKRKKIFRWLHPVIILSVLWLFSFLAGAQPSILRSAVMFSCLILGETLSRKSSIYNTLAFSALLLLCINPFWLWDVGFQLSYSAVLSIFIFMKPIYHLFYIRNKLLDVIWKINAVTIAAQILTVPLTIYHFHQFPVYFMLTNLLAVPLSSAILLGEITLCATFYLPWFPRLLGDLVSRAIGCMNAYVERIETLPLSVWDGFQVSALQAVLLYVFIAGIGCWLINKVRTGIIMGLTAFLLFAVIRCHAFLVAKKQSCIVIYNIPHSRAIDLFSGSQHYFVGDSSLLLNNVAINFHLKPTRVLYRVLPEMTAPFNMNDRPLVFNRKNILLIDRNWSDAMPGTTQTLDLLVISQNPGFHLSTFAEQFTVRQVVCDASVPGPKKKYWKKDCLELGIPFHDVSEEGAFVMNLN
jgi:competence protein ComEC